MTAGHELNRELVVRAIDEAVSELQRLRESVMCDAKVPEAHRGWFDLVKARMESIDLALCLEGRIRQ